jgi:hypothetical protein
VQITGSGGLKETAERSELFSGRGTDRHQLELLSLRLPVRYYLDISFYGAERLLSLVRLADSKRKPLFPELPAAMVEDS